MLQPTPDESQQNCSKTGASPPRRDFLYEVGSIVVGAVITLVPLSVGIVTFLNPLWRRRSGDNRLVRVATLNSIAADGIPRRFPIIADRTNAWTFSPQEHIGAVYVRRLPSEDTVEVFNVICPHAGCSVDYEEDRDAYLCPCHTSEFSLDGAWVMGPSPRGLDPMVVDTEKLQAGEIWVIFENYYSGKKDRVRKS